MKPWGGGVCPAYLLLLLLLLRHDHNADVAQVHEARRRVIVGVEGEHKHALIRGGRGRAGVRLLQVQ